ncbi:MAG: DUF5060 domain-containing protein [Sedimentisphaerales bacterium]|nr:DUF5060 domain-containing protein [Sedimentisphaerales bacterium]
MKQSGNPSVSKPFRCILSALWICLLAASLYASEIQTEQWGVFEAAFDGPSTGNPFVEVTLTATFTQNSNRVNVDGFYDGEGVYRIRFSPPTQGLWTYETQSNHPRLAGKRGSLTAAVPSKSNHGPVGVASTFHFAYADGTPYFQIGTTCYAWVHQEDALQEKTLKTLAGAPFNKIRFCVFPKWYSYNHNEPLLYPFEGTPPAAWDFMRFNPEFFRHFEKRIQQLGQMGIEADLILFHPYDKGHWGFDRMTSEADDRYLRYVVARFAAFRNVWWSLANEYDFMKEKTPADWDRFFQIIVSSDPYGRLRSIHNGSLLYNHTQPWVTHVSIQNGSAVTDFGRAILYRDVYYKPIVFDEIKYEGNLPQRWGNLSAQELVLRFWESAIAGTYAGHGETYLDPNDVIWWAKGGILHGQSPARLGFLRKILADGPAGGLEPIDKWQDYPFAGKRGEYYLGYFGRNPLSAWPFELHKAELADGMRFTVDIIDTWNMTITPAEGVFEIRKHDNYLFADKNGRSVSLPGTPYTALRIRRVK